MEKLAVEYATRMSYVTTMDVLRTLWAEICADRKKLGEEWFAWLRDFKDGTKIRLEPEEEPTWLNEKGKEMWHGKVSKQENK